MNGQQALIAILGIAGIIGVSWWFKAWLNHIAEIKELDYKVEMSAQETKRHQIIADIANDNR